MSYNENYIYSHYFNACCVETIGNNLTDEELYVLLAVGIPNHVDDEDLLRAYGLLERTFYPLEISDKIKENVLLSVDLPSIPEITYDEDLCIFVPGSPVQCTTLDGYQIDQVREAVIAISRFLLLMSVVNNRYSQMVVDGFVEDCIDLLESVLEPAKEEAGEKIRSKFEIYKAGTRPTSRAYIYDSSDHTIEAIPFVSGGAVFPLVDLSLLVFSAVTQPVENTEDRDHIAKDLLKVLELVSTNNRTKKQPYKKTFGITAEKIISLMDELEREEQEQMNHGSILEPTAMKIKAHRYSLIDKLINRRKRST